MGLENWAASTTVRAMRIVAVADTHLYHDALEVPAGDVFIHAGDLCQFGSLEEMRIAAKWIRSLPHPLKIVIAGNHDFCFQRTPELARELMRGTVYLQDEAYEHQGASVWGSPWQPEFFDWAFNLPRGPRLAEKWAMIPTPLDILITHGPPHGIGDRISSQKPRAGCEDLRARVAEVRPLLHLFGHIHEDGGAWEVDGTTFVNCTAWEGDRAPTVVDIDVRARTVEVVEAPPRKRRPRR